ncbi:MAG: N-6 DNA methylase, partial [Armatimonadetes bacterium]|nr:N-6 DNA methylase [Armatimonadota bacterium]
NGRKKVDGAVRDEYSSLGYWEAKDEKDALEIEIKKKIALDYPVTNTIFEDTQHAILWQNARQIGKFDLRETAQVGELLDRFFGFSESDREGFESAVRAFIERVPELARALKRKIDDESGNAKFKAAFGSFFAVCQTALNPAIKESTVKEMLIQHLLTERLFKTVFQDEKWFAGNIIAGEIEGVIAALTSAKWNRADFLKSLDPFFKPIEDRARTLPDYREKQAFLNTLYERFFQGYSTEIADTMGIVYTPQPLVDWMCASVERVLQDEFGVSLATPDVKILDPCTGTGNFIVNLMRRIPKDFLPHKYRHDLFANELMLLPYYVASGNIEHEYFDIYGEHAAFEGLCFQDTLDLRQSAQMGMFAERNTERIARQKAADLMVIIGNPPYNVGQKNENDNNKNRNYKGIKNEPGVDDLIKNTYAKASRATLQNKLYGAYVRFFKWAEARLGERDGVICFVSNNSFVDQHAFDGMRATLGARFNHIWHLDLHGNVRKNPKLSGTTHNVFGIQVGVGVTILVRNSKSSERFIKYHRVPEFARNTEKLDWLAEVKDVSGVEWQTLAPNAKNAWLTEGLEVDFDEFVPMGSKEAKAGFSADSKTGSGQVTQAA